MRPEENGRAPVDAEGAHDSVFLPGNSECTSATDLLVELGQCQRGIRALLRMASGTVAPISSRVLPAVAFTLTGLIHATEMAANKVLDHAEALANERDRLGKALSRLEPLVNTGHPTGKRAWLDVTECNQALSSRVMSIMSAMAFQDLTTQHLGGAIKAVEEVRERLVQMLTLLDLPVETEEPGARRGPSAGSAAGRQALADQLWSEMKERGDAGGLGASR